jgi:hypothetical protein
VQWCSFFVATAQVLCGGVLLSLTLHKAGLFYQIVFLNHPYCA